MFSIVICTYNPAVEALQKCLASCLNQRCGREYEVIIIDNNSKPAINELPTLRDSLNNAKVRILVENEQGLAHARLKGLSNASFDNIVFADDDNVLNEDYLSVLAELNS